jgi:hypothetical protein
MKRTRTQTIKPVKENHMKAILITFAAGLVYYVVTVNYLASCIVM